MARSDRDDHRDGISRSRTIRRERRAREASRDLDFGAQYVMADHHPACRCALPMAPRREAGRAW